ncbi:MULTISPECIES: SURF1 family cytochrome oxidase biogenesis protein [Sphingomonas]|uniref:SURF1 family cytochrome oxidase biogenesis protein n=1 Tax=Sphingomonas TaxID=13687 RepID=UPI000DEF3559|nr:MULTISPECIES: SURF1 family cytochrome oxidase biogenesis protein [Sphingomonas]
MNRRQLIVPTILVLLLVGVLIRLGFWQLDRAHQRDRQASLQAQNLHLPPMAFPASPVGDQWLYRRASGFCLSPVSVQTLGAGGAGFRVLAACRTGAEGPGLTVQLGTTRDPNQKVQWAGGPVSGIIDYAPDERPLSVRLFHHQPRTLMLVAAPPLAGLAANPAPGADAEGNSSWSYAVQWFLFAAVALTIYVIAVATRLRKARP